MYVTGTSLLLNCTSKNVGIYNSESHLTIFLFDSIGINPDLIVLTVSLYCTYGTYYGLVLKETIKYCFLLWT